MTDLDARIHDLIFRQRLSSTQAARQLGLTPAEIVTAAARLRITGQADQVPSPRGRGDLGVRSTSHNAAEEQVPSPHWRGGQGEGATIPESDAEQIAELRRQVRVGLIRRTREWVVSDFPPSALVRLWQLIEDPALLAAHGPDAEESFDLPEDVREKIRRILDEALAPKP